MDFKSNYHFSFENLLVYQKSMVFGESVNERQKISKKEMYRLSSLNFTEHDIAANISEVQEY
jgi:hypothetical protein